MSKDKVRPRSPYLAPHHEDYGRGMSLTLIHKVRLRHPGYDDAANTMIILPALDHSDGGIHYETALIACAIITNNKWEGYLSATRSGESVSAKRDDILRGTDYYFRLSVGLGNDNYPVVPSFAHWRFPHDNLPVPWRSCAISGTSLNKWRPRQSTVAAELFARDVSCRITNHVEATEPAFLVPKSEQDWFNENGMHRYSDRQNPEINPIDDVQNGLLLRSDVRTLFDDKRFAIVPKSSALVCHVIVPGTSTELSDLYHNVSLQSLVGISIHYIFARFAWTMFAQSRHFMQQGLNLNLCVYTGNWETRIAKFSGDRCRELSGFKSRSQIRLIRARGSSSALAEDGMGDFEDEMEDFEGKMEDFENGMKDFDNGMKNFESKDRGRKRQRRFYLSRSDS